MSMPISAWFTGDDGPTERPSERPTDPAAPPAPGSMRLPRRRRIVSCILDVERRGDLLTLAVVRVDEQEFILDVAAGETYPAGLTDAERATADELLARDDLLQADVRAAELARAER